MKRKTKKKWNWQDWSETVGFAYLLLVVFLVGVVVGMVVFGKEIKVIGVPVSPPERSNYPHVGGVRI